MRVFSTTLEFINNSVRAGGWPVGQIIETNGFTVSGDTGGGRWAATGNVIAPSQTPLALNDIRLSDASGNEFELVHTGIIDLNVLGGTSAPYQTIATNAGLVWSQSFTSVPSNGALYYATVADAQAAPNLSIGDVIIIGERANALFDVVAATTNNGFDIIDGTASSVSLRIKIEDYINIVSFGASTASSDNGPAIQAAIDWQKATGSDLAVVIPEGAYQFTTQLVLRTFSKIRGYGPDTSQLVYTGSAATWAITTENPGGGNVAQRVNLKDFAVQGEAGVYDKLLFDANGVRYSIIENVAFLYALKCMRLTLVWGNQFSKCSFKCGGDLGAIPTSSVGIEMATGGAVNAHAFRGCVVSFNEIGVDAGGAGRNVVFSGACTFESNKTVFRFVGAGSSKGVVVEGNYFEANEVNHFYIDNSAGARDDQITIQENYFDITPGILAGVVFVGQIGSGTSSLVVKNNHIEQLVAASNPVNPYVVYFDNISTNYNFQYESNHNFVVTGAGAVKIGHVNWDKIDFRTFSSNIPYKPAYKVNPVAPNNTFAPDSATNAIKIYFKNGMATITGSVVDSGNVFAGLLDIVDIPFTISSAIAQYPIQAISVTAGAGTRVDAFVKGLTISADFSASATDPIYLSGTWPLQGGDYA